MHIWDEETVAKEARDRLGLTALRPFQTLIVLSILESAAAPSPYPILAILPTGGGKSVCFTLPALLLEGISVIVYPIRALMNDQYASLKKKGINASILIGGMTREARKAEIKKLRSGKAKILITNIEMLSSFTLIEELRTFHISLFVVDEAHTVISWGETFRKKYLEIGKIASLLSPTLVVAFTATADERIKKGLESVLFKKMKYHTIYGGSNRVNLVFHAKKAISASGEIFSELQKGNKLPAVVFTRRRADAEKLAALFSSHFDTRYYHAGLENDKKKETEEWFMKSNDGLLVATCAYGMGVDKKNVRSVFHYSLPEDEAMYLQESGRAGRDGERADAYVYLTPFEKSPLRRHFEGECCIRASLIKALGQGYGESCTGCSYCLGETGTQYAGEKDVLAFLKKRPFLYTASRFSKRKDKLLPFYTEKERLNLIKALIKEKKLFSLFQHLVTRKKTAKYTG